MRLCDVDFSNDDICRGAKRNVGKCTRGKCGKYGVDAYSTACGCVAWGDGDFDMNMAVELAFM